MWNNLAPVISPLFLQLSANSCAAINKLGSVSLESKGKSVQSNRGAPEFARLLPA